MTINLFDGIKENWSFSDIDGLQNYLNEVWQSRPLFLADDENETERRSSEQKFFSFFKEYIRPINYVGFVQYDALRVNVYPRVFKDHPQLDALRNPLPAIQHVLKWLSYGSRIHFPFSEVPLQLRAEDDWLEALIYLFANFTLDTLQNCPHFAYQDVTEEMSFVRGRIAMQPYINHNLAKGRHHLMHCTYEPFLYDNQFNRIVKYVCKVLLAITENNANRRLLNDIHFLLDEVSDIHASAEDCGKVPVTRLNPEIATITNMCSAFLSNQVYSDGVANTQNLCILLPMEVIYEQYVAGSIQTYFPKLHAKSQASGEYVALTGEGFSKKVFQMQHDILLPDKMIIDTKYKFRYVTDDCKGGVNQNDVYQLVTYLYKRKMKKGLLLYPTHFDKGFNNEMHEFKVDDFMIEASSMDITEEDFENFEKLQKKKLFEVLLQVNNYLL